VGGSIRRPPAHGHVNGAAQVCDLAERALKLLVMPAKAWRSPPVILRRAQRQLRWHGTQAWAPVAHHEQPPPWVVVDHLRAVASVSAWALWSTGLRPTFWWSGRHAIFEPTVAGNVGT
jgi:hypothetical protein